mmetsp:Transcript_11642/g.17385  ORF Transcript_11642/g.17385 Transcript_11642/m.17385 type:complete len:250 (+) Transcript_11642:134-883(+)
MKRAATLSPGHYADNSKSCRHDIFAAWLVSTLGIVAKSNVVLDIAGGSAGSLSWALWRHGFETFIVDPRAKLGYSRRQRKEIQKYNAPPPTSLPIYFDHNFENKYHQLLTRTSLIVGLHSDEATEQIVDYAIKYGTRFAVVPCCVFPHLFPHRRISINQSEPLIQRPVLSNRDFEQYLISKHPQSIRIAHLNFQGRNAVIFRDHPSEPMPHHSIAVPVDSDHVAVAVKGDRWREEQVIKEKQRAATTHH